MNSHLPALNTKIASFNLLALMLALALALTLALAGNPAADQGPWVFFSFSHYLTLFVAKL